MFKIKFSKNHELSIPNIFDRSDDASIPRWQGRKIIRIQGYNSFLGPILYFFGYAVKVQTDKKHFIYLKKPNFLRLISKNEEEQKEVFSRLLPHPSSVIKKEDFIAELQQIYENVKREFNEIDFRLINAADKLNKQRFEWEKLEEVILFISKNLAIGKLKKKDVIKLKESLQALQNEEISVLSHLRQGLPLLEKYMENGKIDKEQFESLISLFNTAKPLVLEQMTKSEKAYFKSLDIINNKLKKLINHPGAISSIPISQLQILLKLEYLFPELNATLSRFYRSKALMNYLIATSEDYGKAISQENNPLEQLKRENDLIEFFSHILKNFSTLDEEKFLPQVEECSKHLHSSTERIKGLGRQLYRVD